MQVDLVDRSGSTRVLRVLIGSLMLRFGRIPWLDYCHSAATSLHLSLSASDLSQLSIVQLSLLDHGSGPRFLLEQFLAWTSSQSRFAACSVLSLLQPTQDHTRPYSPPIPECEHLWYPWAIPAIAVFYDFSARFLRWCQVLSVCSTRLQSQTHRQSCEFRLFAAGWWLPLIFTQSFLSAWSNPSLGEDCPVFSFQVRFWRLFRSTDVFRALNSVYSWHHDASIQALTLSLCRTWD